MWCHLLKFSDPLHSRQGPFVDSGLIVLVTTAQSGHGPFCSLAVLFRSFDNSALSLAKDGLSD